MAKKKKARKAKAVRKASTKAVATEYRGLTKKQWEKELKQADKRVVQAEAALERIQAKESQAEKA